MKAAYLFLSVSLVVTTATAQQRAKSVVFSDDARRMSAAHEPEKITVMPASRHSDRMNTTAERTTNVPTSRWYNYGDYLGVASTVSFAANYLWNDTTSVDAYASSVGVGTDYLFNNMVSVGLVCDPYYFGWNDASLFPDMMQLSPANAYTIDSVFISGIYYRNNAKTAPVDTLTVAIIYGDGSTASNLHYKAIDTTGGRSWIYDEFGVDSLYYMNMHHDSINNRADTFAGGMPPVIKKIYLTNTDTSADYETVIPVSINVPAGSIPAVSVSFKSGDPSFTPGDTVFQSNGSTPTYKYGMFRPFLAYVGTSATPAFPINSPYDLNEGQFRDEGYNSFANNLYRPQWFWYNGTTGGASTYQYPYFGFHISCPTCFSLDANKVLKNKVTANAFPDPANSKAVISFSLPAAADVSVSLTDMVGRVVAVKKVENAMNGQVVFDTADLPDGMYIYTLSSNSGHIAGRLLVRH